MITDWLAAIVKTVGLPAQGSELDKVDMANGKLEPRAQNTNFGRK
jgi:hypothetical protein